MEWRRHVFAFLAHLGFALMFIHRLNLSVTIIPMVNTLPFKWGEAGKGVILSAFYYGYIPGLIPAGILVDKYGGMYKLLDFHCHF